MNYLIEGYQVTLCVIYINVSFSSSSSFGESHVLRSKRKGVQPHMIFLKISKKKELTDITF